MKRVVIIGGKGKVGTYLVPMLCADGFEVVNVSRGASQSYLPHGCWNSVEQVNLNREDPEFPQKISALKPDIVVDMICFQETDLKALTNALAGKTEHYLACGSVWIHGPVSVSPCTEAQDLTPFGTYGIEKLKMVHTLEREYALHHFPGTIIHPGHIVGPGHLPLNPQANKNPAVFEALIHGQPLELPNFGMETIHHVHAKDVAGVFLAAIRAGSISYGQSFHAVSSGAVTLKGYAQEVASWFGTQAKLVFKPFDEWKNGKDTHDAEQTLDHITRSPNYSMEKAKRLLGFSPRYTSFEAVKEALDWMLQNGIVK